MILVRSAAGKFVATRDSGAGLQAVMEAEPGTDAPTGVNATSSRRVERTATTPRSADAAARKLEQNGGVTGSVRNWAQPNLGIMLNNERIPASAINLILGIYINQFSYISSLLDM